MISIKDETLIPISQAPKHLPKRPNGKYIHISAVYRWIKNGLRGVTLESLRVGGTTYTSVEALQRFASRLSFGPSTRSALSHRSDSSTGITSQALEIELGLVPGRLGNPS